MALFTIVPTLVELGAVGAVLAAGYDLRFTGVLLAPFLVHTVFSVVFTQPVRAARARRR